MPDNNTNIPMNNGNFPNDNLASIITQQLDSNFSSITSQLKAITDALKESIKIQKDSSKQQTTGGQSDDRKVDKSLRDVLNSIASYSRDLKRTVSQVGSSIQTMTEELEDATEAIESSNKKDASKYLREEQRKMKQQEKENLEKIQEIIKQAQEGTKDASGNVIDVGIKSLEEEVGKLQEKLKDTTLSEADRLEKEQKLSNVSEELERRYRDLSSMIDRETEKNEEAQRARKKQLAEFEKRIGAVNKGLDGLKSKSPYLNNNIKNEEDEEDPVKEMKELIEAQKKLIQNANEAIRKEKDNLDAEKRNIELQMQQLDDSNDEDKKKKDEYKKRLELIEQNRNNLTHQEEVNNKQLETLGKWNPVRDAFSKVADSFKNSLKKLGDFALDRLENYFLNAYKEGFERVYQSIENTRNTISARLKLSQGEYSDLQSDIQDMIESAGMQGTITQSEVNDAIASLQGAGVTDTEVLKTLAFEQAKLKASGSSVDLGNEETLQQMREFIHNQMSVYGMSEQEAVKSYTDLLETLAAGQAELGTSGWDSTLVNGGLNTIMNQIMETDNAMQKSADDIANNILSAAQWSEAQHEIGLDPTTLYQYLKDLRDGTVASNSTFEKYLNNLGIDREAVLTKGIGELNTEIANALQQNLAGVDERYLPEYAEAWGFGLTTTQMKRLQNNELQVQEFSKEQIDARKADTEKALQDSKYQSATLTHQKEAENSMAEIAIHAEKIYEGDKWVMAGFDAVTDILKTIRSSITDIISTMWKSGVGNTLGSSGGSGGVQGIKDVLTGVGNTYSAYSSEASLSSFADLRSGASQGVTADFLTGNMSTTAGKIGTAAGVIAGGAMIGHSAYEHIKENDGANFNAFVDMSQDSETWAGVGTAIGTAVGGPLAGAVVGGLMGIGGKLGTAWAEKIETKLDPFQEAVNDFKKTTSEKLENDKKEYNDIKSTLDEYESISKKHDTEAMKQLLLEESNISSAKLMNATEQEIQDLFKDNLLDQQRNLATEKDLQMSLDEILSKDSQQTVELNQDWGNIALTQYGKAYEAMNSEEKQQFISDNINQFVGQGKDVIKDVTSKAQEVKSLSGSDLDTYLIQAGVSASDIKNKTEQEKQEMAYSSYIEKFKSEAGFTNETADLYDEAIRQYDERRAIYEEKSKELQSRWEEATKKAKSDGGSGLSDIMLTYLSLYHVDKTTGQPESWGDAEKDIIINKQDGTVSLDPGDLYRYSYAFKTGLTEVPADDYPALLHKGERVLTKEEASVYNKLSSYAVDQIVNNSKSIDSSMSAEEAYSNLSSYAISQIEENVYNKLGSTSPLSTTAYGNFDNLETSINNQTSSLSDILNQILAAIQNLATYSGLYAVRGNASKVRQNVLKGNSNITQINTL